MQFEVCNTRHINDSLKSGVLGGGRYPCEGRPIASNMPTKHMCGLSHVHMFVLHVHINNTVILQLHGSNIRATLLCGIYKAYIVLYIVCLVYIRHVGC